MQRRRKILLSLISDVNEFQLLQAADAKRVAAAHDLELEIRYAGSNAIQQIHQAFEAIHGPESQRPDAVLMEPISGNGLERLVRNVAKSGIGWVSINRHSPWLAELRDEHPELPIASVTSDQIAVGKIQGKQVQALLPQGGNVLCIQGPPQHTAAIDRRKGFEKVVESSGIEIASIDAQWTEESGEQAMQSWLRLRSGGGSERLDLIVCQNDDMAAGARRILLQQARNMGHEEWKNVPFLGVDGLPEGGQRMVDIGELVATVVNPSNTGPAVEVLAKAFASGAPTPAELVLPPESYPPLAEISARR